jgi:hypothetical protein
VDFQRYLDKAAARLTPWIGKFLNHAGCAALVKSVLTAMPIFPLTFLMVDKNPPSRLSTRFTVECYGHARIWLVVASVNSTGQRFVAPKGWVA